jgi:hypothetical protein|tara:strand:- start:541 stop:684 length:144 start_codon:yes stop_codon:yes gene_type:complete
VQIGYSPLGGPAQIGKKNVIQGEEIIKNEKYKPNELTPAQLKAKKQK